MEVLRDRKGNPAYSLPEEGIYDQNGILLHHGYPRAVLEVHRKRLAQHGIVLEGKKYSEQEIETLNRNWEAYRKEYGFSYWSIHKLCGKGSTNSERQEKNGKRAQIREFLRETNFWPRFCAGLSGRTSLSIKSMVCRIFDPYRDCHVAIDERPYCEKLYLSTRSLLIVADTMRRSTKSVRACIDAAQNRKQFSISERRWLWISVKNAYPALFESTAVPKAEMIDWKSMESKLLRSSSILEQQWTAMIGEIEAEIKDGRTFDEALDIVAPKCQRVSPLQVVHFINIVKGKVVNEDDRRIGRAEAFIAPLMREQGLTGFHSRRFSEFNYLRFVVNGIILKCRKRILKPCRMVLPLKQLLRLIAEMLRTLPNSDTPRTICLTTEHFFRTLLRLKRERDSTWRPQSKKLRKFISKLLPDLL